MGWQVLLWTLPLPARNKMKAERITSTIRPGDTFGSLKDVDKEGTCLQFGVQRNEQTGDSMTRSLLEK